MLTVPVAEWLERHAGKQESMVRFQVGHNYIFILKCSLNSRCSQLGEAYTHEFKHDIHPELWVQRDTYRFNTSKNIATVSMTMGQF